MEKLGRARVNFLRGRFRKGEDLHAEAWEIKNYRDLDLEALFQGLSHQGCDLDVDSFEEIAKEVETPEELAEKLELDEKGYLYIFELWRRLLDHRETISIFCDELDAVIDEYEDHPEENEEILGVLLTELVDIWMRTSKPAISPSRS